MPVRTRDALHLATMDFLRGHGQAIEPGSIPPDPDAKALTRAPAQAEGPRIGLGPAQPM